MMMLAIDTASRSCGVAVVSDGAVLAEINDASGQTHSRRLMGMVDRALSMSGGHPDRIEAYAVTRGPGSFTGLRIGISTAKGLAEAAGKPLIGVSSLEALAWQVFPADRLIVPMLDARRKEVYAARFRREGGGLAAIGREAALPPEAAVAGIAEPCLLVGDGAVAYAERLQGVLGDRLQLALPFQHILRASTVAFLAQLRMAAVSDERVALTPRYLRKSYADNVPRRSG